MDWMRWRMRKVYRDRAFWVRLWRFLRSGSSSFGTNWWAAVGVTERWPGMRYIPPSSTSRGQLNRKRE